MFESIKKWFTKIIKKQFNVFEKDKKNYIENQNVNKSFKKQTKTKNYKKIAKYN